MRMTAALPVLLAGLTGLVAGCTVLPADEAQALRDGRSERFDAHHAAAAQWPGKARDAFFARAVTLEDLRSRPLDQWGRLKGHRAGEGSAWTFVIRGSGTVRAVDLDGPQGRIALDSVWGPLALQAGPLTTGTAIRDAIPSIAFDDFPDQIAFAEFGMALTERATATTRPILARLRPGQHVGFVGAATITPSQPIVVTPVEVTP